MIIFTSVLFSSDALPGDAAFDLDALQGLAEWRCDIPLLFKLLMGPDARPCHWPVYDFGEDGYCVLAVPMGQARQSWQQLTAMMARPRDAATIVARSAIAALLASSDQWLVLDCVQLIPHDVGTPQYEAALQQLRVDAAQLHAALMAGERSALAPLLDSATGSTAAFGYWSASASAQLFDIEELETDTLPFMANLDVQAWHDDALCYEVTPAGQSQPVGLVTPYGRWIVPLALGASEVDVHDAQHGWLTVTLSDGSEPRTGLADLNGMQVLPPAAGALYIVNAHLALQVDTTGAGRLLHLPDGAVLHENVEHVSPRDDGYIDFERQRTDAHDERNDERNNCGVLDATGKVVLQPCYSSVQDFGKKNRLAIVSQRIDGRFLFGLANTDGVLLSPCQYSEIDSATTSSPPRVRKKLIYAVDAAGRVCLLRQDGQQAFVPRYAPAHHLRGVVIQDDFLYVASEGMAWRMDFTGQLIAQAGTLEQFKADVTAELSAAMGLSRPADDRIEINAYTPAQLLEQADPGELHAMARMLVLGDSGLAASCVRLMQEELEQEDPEAQYEGATPEAACLFSLWSTAAHALGFGTTLDWKAVDEIEHIGAHIDVPALQDFAWHAREDGDRMEEGLRAIGRHLAPHGLQLVNVMSGDDTFYLGLLRDQDVAAFERMAEGTGRAPQRY